MTATPVAIGREVLAERFGAILGSRGGQAHGRGDVEDAVAVLLDAATAAHPTIDVPVEVFLEHVARQLPLEPALDEAVRQCHVGDLLLAFACAQQSANALEAFERSYAEELRVVVAKTRGAPALEDARQLVWQKLFVGSAAFPPKILEYSGRGRLRHWFRVTVVRTLLDEIRKNREPALLLDEQRALLVPSPAQDPETEYLRRLYSKEFEEAFEEAVAKLEAEDRNVLRSYYAQQLTIDQISSVFGIHRATAARRVKRAKERLLTTTRSLLSARLKLTDSALGSVLRLIESQMHLSVQRLLSTPPP